MGDRMKQFGKQIKNILKKALGFKYYLIVGGAIVIILILISACVFIIKKDDAKNKKDDKTNVPNAVAEYNTNVTIGQDGTINTSLSAQELWNKMVKNDSRVTTYLQNISQLKKLMDAQLVTMYPDTRANPDAPINWKNILGDVNSKEVQGIIKIKRKDTNGNISTLTYAEPDQFDDWVESGDSEALKHFTMDSNSSFDSEKDSNGQYVHYDGDAGKIIDVAAKRVGGKYVWGGDNWGSGPSDTAVDCSHFVYHVLKEAGVYNGGYVISSGWRSKGKKVSSLSEAQAGDVICYSGHVAIYDGNSGIYHAKGKKYGIVHDDYANSNSILAIRRFAADGTSTVGQDASSSSNQDETSNKNTGNTTDSLTNKTSYYVKIATWEETDSTTTLDGSKTDSSHSYTLETTNINYQELIQKYQMPFEYLWSFMVLGEDYDIVSEIADLVYNSQIEITAFDNLETETVVSTETYDTKIEHEDKDSKGNKTVTYTYEPHTKVKTTITKTNTIDTGVTLADIWFAKYTRDFTKQSSTTKSSSGPDSLEDSGNNVNRKISVTDTLTTESYTAADPVIKEKTEKKSPDNPNFVSIFCESKNYETRRAIVDGASDWLFDMLEENDSTKELVDLTKYLFYKINGINYGVTEFDFKEYLEEDMQSITGAYGDYIVKTTAQGAAEAVTDKTKMEQGLKKWLRASGKMKSNATSVLDTVMNCQDKYHVNAVFVYAFLRTETGIGTANTNYVNHDNNWGSWSLGTTFSSPQDNIETITKNMANGNIYFTKGNISVSKIGAIYCPNDSAHPTQGDDWIKTVNGYMTDLYSAMGIQASITGNGSVAKGGKGTLGVYTSSKGLKFNLYLQGANAPWANEDYGDSHSMKEAGCGPTAAAIIASAYNADITPSTMREEIVRKYGGGNHSSATYIQPILKKLLPNVHTEVAAFNETKIANCLKNGGQVWIVVANCKYTSGAHCMALIDYKNSGMAYVAHGSANYRPYGWEKISYLHEHEKHNIILYVGGK